jgi:hypothetical protein
MVNKFNRQYRLTLKLTEEDEAIVIEPPFTIKFSIQKTISSSVNQMKLEIYNLGKILREKIFQDRFNIKKYKKVILQAGYDRLSTIFVGNILEATSYRRKQDIITYINAQDGGFSVRNSYSSFSIEAGESFKGAIGKLFDDMQNVSKGKIGDIVGSFKRGVVFNGNTYNLLKEQTKENVFIDNEVINALKEDEVIVGEVPLITSETGLKNTPIRRDSFIEVELVFEPRIVISQIIEIKSTINSLFDGQYKVIGIKHNATISESIGGEASTILQLFIGSQLLGGLKTV